MGSYYINKTIEEKPYACTLFHVLISYLAASPPPGGKPLMSSLDKQCIV